MELDKKTGQWKATTVVKAKGIPLGKSKASQLRNWDTLANGGSVPITGMTRIRENIKAGILDPNEDFYRKRLSIPDRRVTKRRFYPDGNSRPYHVKELDEWLKLRR